MVLRIKIKVVNEWNYIKKQMSNTKSKPCIIKTKILNNHENAMCSD